MGDPELRNDEKVLVRTPGVYVKSIPFEGILTNKRIILVDRAKNLLPPKEIPLATVKEIESGENAIRDQTLTLSVMAKTGETRQMILTFSRQEGGNRIKERDEWARQIRENLGSTFENVIRKVIPGADAAPRKTDTVTPSRVSVVNTVAQPVPIYRETESVHPITKIMDSGTAPAVHEFDASTLGQHVFCSRCGNKVPTGSAFCNRCGSSIVAPASASAPVSPPSAPLTASVMSNQRPIDRDIQTIEPLIERSTVKIPADPLRKPIPDVPVQQSLAWDDDAIPSPAPVPVVAPATTPPAPIISEEKSEARGILPRIFSPKARSQAPPPSVAAPPVPERPKRSTGFMPDKKVLMAIGAVIVIIAVVAIGVIFVLPMLTSGGINLPSTGTGDVTPAPTSSSSTLNPSGTVVPITIKPSTIPATGVSVHVNYLGGFKGSYGMKDALTTVPGNSGDRVWEVENANMTVLAEFEKLDGSSHEMLVEIYKDGVVLTKGSTTVGHGTVKLSVDPLTGTAAEPITSGGGTATAAVTTAAEAAATTAVTTAAVTTTAITTSATTAPATNTTTASP